jgi:endonuclease/exonuclease/phosphatase family metal-dependent hydrolase
MAGTECTILTLNIFHDLPMYRHLPRRCALIAEEIARRRPHIAALQEVLRASGYGDIGVKLHDAVNRLCGGEVYRLDYARADGAGDGEFGFEEGLALLSRIETDGPAESLRFRAQVELAAEVGGPRYRQPDDRVAMRRRFRLESGATIDFCVSRLTDRPECIDGTPVRTLQARQLAQWALERTAPEMTVVLAGDFNDVPGSDTIESLKRAGFVDLHEAFGRGPGYTNNRDNIDLSAELATHNQRIDYLMVRRAGGCAPDLVEVRPFAERPHRESDGTWLWPSDHIGVIASLRL